MIPQPPKLSDLRAKSQLVAGMGLSTVLADFDFETYSPAGFVWNAQTNKFNSPEGANRKGLPAIGTAVYSEHPDTEVLSLAYNLKDGHGSKLWKPGDYPPMRLFHHISAGRLLEAWNVTFESWIWDNVCVPKYGWPPLQYSQLRCAMAKARAHGLPGGLEAAGNVLNIENKKDKDGTRLLNLFSMPRNPTKNDPRTRILPSDAPQDAEKLYVYNIRDIEAEAELSSLIPDLSPEELEFWRVDQRINRRGVAMDREAIKACIAVVDQAHEKYNAEIRQLTKDAVQYASEIQKIRKWMEVYDTHSETLDSAAVKILLSQDGLPFDVRRVLEIRELLGSSAVAKLYTMITQLTNAGRMHDLFVYHSTRTGRAAGRGVQPQNLPNSGESVWECVGCNKHYGKHRRGIDCPWCGYGSVTSVEWNPKAVNDAIETMPGGLECVEYFWGNAIATVSGCIRGMFISAPGKDLICSDFSAIEAVVLAALAGEQWQLDVFNTHGMIYEATACKLTGLTLEEMQLYKSTSGHHHPSRRLGKVSSLASGYGSWIGGWKAFGADEFLNDDEIKKAILAWRATSPAIVELWGGQERNWKPEYYGLEGAAVQAILNPGNTYPYRGLSFVVKADVLYGRLLSGRYLTYHKPRLRPSERRKGTYAISFEGWNSNPKYGPPGWVRMDTYSGKITENFCQAVARDILAYAIVNLEKAGYPVVLHVHDEIVCEIPENWGSIEDFERIMSTMPTWAKGWPIKAKGGWRAKRYAK